MSKDSSEDLKSCLLISKACVCYQMAYLFPDILMLIMEQKSVKFLKNSTEVRYSCFERCFIYHVPESLV